MSELKDDQLKRDIIRLFFENHKSATAVIRAYQREKSIRHAPFTESYVRKLIDKFNNGQFIMQRKPGSGRPSFSSAIHDEVIQCTEQKMAENPHGITSVRNVSASTGISKSSVHRILSNANYKSYKPRAYQQLLPQDYESRIEFANRALNDLPFDKVLYSDETYFSLHGNIHSLRESIWSKSNPQALLERPLQSEKLLVWCGFSERIIIPPYFIEGTLNGERII